MCMHNIRLLSLSLSLNVDALIKLIKAFSGCKITWIGDACFSMQGGREGVRSEWISFC